MLNPWYCTNRLDFLMSDNTALVGLTGTVFTWAFANYFFGTIAGVLTCIYVIWKMIRLYRNK